MAPGVTGKWVLNTTNLPAVELRALKSHLPRGFPTIVGRQVSTALVSDGGLPHQKTAQIGTELPISVLDHDGVEWDRQLMVSGRAFVSRTGDLGHLITTLNRYCPIIDANQWKDRLINVRSDVAEAKATDPSPTLISAPVVAGGAIGADRLSTVEQIIGSGRLEF